MLGLTGINFGVSVCVFASTDASSCPKSQCRFGPDVAAHHQHKKEKLMCVCLDLFMFFIENISPSLQPASSFKSASNPPMSP